jgi:tetratricopeptide (TPR) repeat protein
MHSFPFVSTLRADKTLAAALSFVALVGLAELGAVAYYYAARTHAAYKLAQPAAPVSSTTLPTAEEQTSPAALETSTEPATTATAATQPAVSIGDRLLRQARKLRERGDTTTALARLQEALQADPKNANVLAEMAMIYESIQLFDRSNETWRRVQELGPAAGALYELADMKLKIGVSAPASTPNNAATLAFGADGIPDGSTFGITEVTPTQTNDPDADTHLMLRVAVKKRPETPIDYTKVKIQVFFYDTADNDQRVVLTDAEVSYEWLTPHHNWQDANPEILAVTYLRPKKDALSSDAALTAAASAVTPPMPGKRSRPSKPPTASESLETGPRKYLGYIVRVYYKDQLQAVRAEPNRLLNLFPPPFTAPTQ